jgi:hypothetical protein
MTNCWHDADVAEIFVGEEVSGVSLDSIITSYFLKLFPTYSHFGFSKYYFKSILTNTALLITTNNRSVLTAQFAQPPAT